MDPQGGNLLQLLSQQAQGFVVQQELLKKAREVEALEKKRATAWELHKEKEAQQVEVTKLRGTLDNLRKKLADERGATKEIQNGDSAHAAEEQFLSEKDNTDLSFTTSKGSLAKVAEQRKMLTRLRRVCGERIKEMREQEKKNLHPLLQLRPMKQKLRFAELRERFPECKVPQQLRSVQSHMQNEGAVVPCPEPVFSQGADVTLLADQGAGEATLIDGCKYTAKVLLLTTCKSASDHPFDTMQVVGAKLLETSTLVLYGGPWCFKKDGGDPRNLETLSEVARRHLQAQAGADLREVPFARFCSFDYENEVVEYLVPDPEKMSSVTLKPMARLDSRQLAHDFFRQWKGTADRGGPGTAEEKVVARVVSVPAAVCLEDALNMRCDDDKTIGTWELAIACRLAADRLRRNAGNKMTNILNSLRQMSKRKAEEQDIPLHMDEKVPSVPEGIIHSYTKRIKASKLTTDTSMLKGYQFFDTPDSTGARSEVVSRRDLLSNLASLGSLTTYEELDNLLSAGFDDTTNSYYPGTCSHMKTNVTYDTGEPVSINLCL